MPLTVPADYAGEPFPDSLMSLLPILDRYSFSLKATGSAKRTASVLWGDTEKNCGYINGDVIRRKGVIGYHFANHGLRMHVLMVSRIA